MADLNVVYAPVIEEENADIILDRICSLSIAGICVGHYTDLYLPDEVRAEIRNLNNSSLATANAVKVPYKGTTGDERETWLIQTIQAVNNRVQFISERSNQLLDRMKDTGSVAYDATVKIFTSALSLVPVVGSAISYITGKQDAARAIDDYKLQTLIKSYASDLTQLGQIRAQLIKEYQAYTSDTKDIPNEASTPWPTSYYVAIAVIVLMILLYIRKRNLEM